MDLRGRLGCTGAYDPLIGGVPSRSQVTYSRMPIWLQGTCGPLIGGVPPLFSWTRGADWDHVDILVSFQLHCHADIGHSRESADLAPREHVAPRLGGFPPCSRGPENADWIICTGGRLGSRGRVRPRLGGSPPLSFIQGKCGVTMWCHRRSYGRTAGRSPFGPFDLGSPITNFFIPC
jgi:hypothetical protein